MKSLIAAVLLMLPAVALAQPHRTYIAVQAGGSWLTTNNYTNNYPSDVKVVYKRGYAAAVRLGQRFDQNWRIELEGAYTANEADTITDEVPSNPAYGIKFPASGNLTAVSLMVNMLYDFSPRGRWHPYVGGGLGATQVSLNNIGVQGASPVFWDAHKGFSYQGIVGVEMDLTHRVAVYASYHYIGAQLPRFYATNGASGNVYYHANVASIGLRWFL